MDFTVEHGRVVGVKGGSLAKQEQQLVLFRKYLADFRESLEEERDCLAQTLAACIEQYPLSRDKAWFTIEELADLCAIDRPSIWRTIADYPDVLTTSTDYVWKTGCWVTTTTFKDRPLLQDVRSNENALNAAITIVPSVVADDTDMTLVDAITFNEVHAYFISALATAAAEAESVPLPEQASNTYSRIGNFVTCLRRQFQFKPSSLLISHICSLLTDVSIWEDVLVLRPASIYGKKLTCVFEVVSSNTNSYKRKFYMSELTVKDWIEHVNNPDLKQQTALDIHDIKRHISDMTNTISETKKMTGKVESMFDRLATALEKL